MKENRNCILLFDSLWFGLKSAKDNRFVFVQFYVVNLLFKNKPDNFL